MTISFKPLEKSHFPLMLKWLNTSHVKKWWDSDIEWTSALIEQKYSSYTEGFKLQDGINKPIHAFIIYRDEIATGYIQIYNAHDFPRSRSLKGFPAMLSALDIFIGEESALHTGLGSKAINEFLIQHQNIAGSQVLVDPDKNNKAAIRYYEKAEFRVIAEEADALWMVRDIEGFHHDHRY